MTDILDRWNQIAAYLNISEKTAMRCKDRGLPIVYDPSGHPITTKTLLDEWRYGKLRKMQTASAE